MTATARLLAELGVEVLAVPVEDGGWQLVLALGPAIENEDEAAAEEAAAGLADRLTQALTEDLAPPLRVPSERLALPPTTTSTRRSTDGSTGTPTAGSNLASTGTSTAAPRRTP